MKFKLPISAALAICMLAATAWADWPQFRGPKSAGTSDATGLPLTWSDEENVIWRTELPGPGASSPVAFGDRIYATCYSGYGLSKEAPGDEKNLKRHLVALDRATGKIVWNQEMKADLPEQPYARFIPLHGYASSTPTVDETGVYVFYGKTGAAAYSHTGSLVWKTNLGTKVHAFGSANSPVLYKDMVINNASVESGDLVALDKKTGKEVWRATGLNRSWNTPVLVDVDSKQELVVNTQGKILAFDPSNGKPLWQCIGIPDYICPSVIAHDGIVYAIGGRKNTSIAVKAGGRGDVTKTHRLWSVGAGSNVSSPVLHKGHLYFVKESGIAFCLDAKSGKEIYKERIRPSSGLIYASPTAVDGRIYYISREKGAFVLPAEPKFELLAHNTLKTDESIFNGSPAVSRGQFLLRSNKYLYCIGKK
ncbi:MAG: PQQ-binding-like beta-propeller repeat protein [Pirellulales bacterium]|nr:PQQ-binding-like beta-propeller repeat protein [Pirellulales bacterium]